MDQDFITRFIYESNAIENSSLSLDDTKELLENKKEATTWEEKAVMNQKEAIDYLEENKKELNNGMIIHLGEIINHNIKEIKGYRKVPVMIQNATITPSSPEQIPSQMSEALYQYEKSTLPVEEKVAMYHILFENIHPLEDGNGRVGRLIMNYQLQKENKKPIIISKENREEYFQAIENHDINALAKLIRQLQENDK